MSSEDINTVGKYRMINFKPIDLESKELYERYLFEGETRGCEYSFANLYMWGKHSMAIVHDHIVLFAQFRGRNIYPFPLGKGDKKAVLDAIIEDARERGIPCQICGVFEEEKRILEELYPGKFSFNFNRDSFDYVYFIDDLADLKGRKYCRKRNHLHRFHDAYPEYQIEPLGEENLLKVRQMLEQWYERKLQENPESDFDLEQVAIAKALDDYQRMKLEGMVLLDGENVLAFTMGSRLSRDTFDVHFEKARWDVDGAYTAINREFAQYIREKFPEIRFLDREEDMGLEGLRKAKLSYNPHHLVEKCNACFVEESNDH